MTVSGLLGPCSQGSSVVIMRLVLLGDCKLMIMTLLGEWDGVWRSARGECGGWKDWEP
jgi:hypothetical protein